MLIAPIPTGGGRMIYGFVRCAVSVCCSWILGANYFYSARKLIFILCPMEVSSLSQPGWLVTYWCGLPARRWSPVWVLTGPDVEQLRWSLPTFTTKPDHHTSAVSIVHRILCWFCFVIDLFMHLFYFAFKVTNYGWIDGLASVAVGEMLSLCKLLSPPLIASPGDGCQSIYFPRLCLLVCSFDCL